MNDDKFKMILSVEDVNKLTHDIIQKFGDYRPKCIIAIKEGGLPLAFSLYWYYYRQGFQLSLFAIKASSYDENHTKRPLEVGVLECIVGESSLPEDEYLVVDDVNDSGDTMLGVIYELILRGFVDKDHLKTCAWLQKDRSATRVDYYGFHLLPEDNLGGYPWIVFPKELKEDRIPLLHDKKGHWYSFKQQDVGNIVKNYTKDIVLPGKIEKI